MRLKALTIALILLILVACLIGCGNVEDDVVSSSSQIASSGENNSGNGSSSGDESDGEKYENTSESLSLVFLADISNSVLPLRDVLIDNMKIEHGKALAEYESASLYVVAFAKDVEAVFTGENAIEEFESYSPNPENGESTNIAKALEKALWCVQGKMDKKQVVLLSDGLELEGDSKKAARALTEENVELTSVLLSLEKEVQLISVNTQGIVEPGEEITIEVVLRVKGARDCTFTIYDDEMAVIKRVDATLKDGTNCCQTKITPYKDGFNVIYVSAESKDDSLDGNNTLCSWFIVSKEKRTVLVVDGDYGTGTSQLDQIKNSAAIKSLGNCEFVPPVSPENCPSTVEELLKYDQVILMDVDFNRLPYGAEDSLKRYVEELGGGLLVSFGDNYYKLNEGMWSCDEGPISEILPVELKTEGERETNAMVLVVDLSASMRYTVGDGNTTRFEMMVDSVKKMIMQNGEGENKGLGNDDYLGIICFDQDYKVVLEMQQLGDYENRVSICKAVEYELMHYYYYYYYDANGNVTDIPVGVDDGDKYISLGYVKPSGIRGIYDGKTNWYIKSYGTSYKWAIQEASNMLGNQIENTKLHNKRVVFMSDGAPNDKGSGYIGIVERMARAGTVTSTIFFGSSEDDMSELMYIANAGKGSLAEASDAEELLRELLKNVDESELINERPVSPQVNSMNSTILKGLSGREFDVIGGYYPSTIKDGAELILYVDNLRPLYAEWEYGLGKVAVYMSDLGNPDWTGTLFDEGNQQGTRLVGNIFSATFNREKRLTGLEYTVKADGDGTLVLVTAFKSLRASEILVARMYNKDGKLLEEQKAVKRAEKTYAVTFGSLGYGEIARVELYIIREDDEQIFDHLEFMVVRNEHHPEYDVLKEKENEEEEPFDPPSDGGMVGAPKILYVSKYVKIDSQGNKTYTSSLYFGLIANGYSIKVEDIYNSTNEIVNISGYDIYIFEGITPEKLPTDGAVWLIGADSGLVAETGNVIGEKVSGNDGGYKISLPVNVGKIKDIIKNVDFDSPLKYGDSVIYAAVSSYSPVVQLGESFSSVYEVEGTPIFIAGELGGEKMIITTFDFSNSSLVAFITDFPMLVKNMINFSIN